MHQSLIRKARLLRAGRFCLKIVPCIFGLISTVLVYRMLKRVVFNLSENHSDDFFDTARILISDGFKILFEFASKVPAPDNPVIGFIAMIVFFFIAVMVAGGIICGLLWITVEFLDYILLSPVGQILTALFIFSICIFLVRSRLTTWWTKWSKQTRMEEKLISQLWARYSKKVTSLLPRIFSD